MVKNKVSIERQINERQYQFVCPYESTLEECLMVIEDIKKYVVERLEDAKKQKEEKPQEE